MIRHLPELLFLAGALALGTAAAVEPLPEKEIPALLQARIDDAGGSGMVVGVIDRQGRRFYSVGTDRRGGTRRVDEHTLFEIGSVTKVFTSLLLADMVVKGEVALDDPVQKYLPPDVKVPERDGDAVRLVDLSMHTSGLPRDLVGANSFEPFAKRAPSVPHLYEFVSSSSPAFKPGTQFNYSNVGPSLLGFALANRKSQSYESLMQARVLVPLGMEDTHFLDDASHRRLPQGYVGPVRHPLVSHIAAYRPAGGLLSSADDLLKLLSAALGLAPTPLDPALALMRKPDQAKAERRLGWLTVRRRHGSEVWAHGGNTFGFSSAVAFDALNERAVVVLANGRLNSPNDIAHTILNRKFQLDDPKGPPPAFRQMLEASGYRQVLPAYRAMGHRDPKFVLTEEMANIWGLGLMHDGRKREAIEVLAFNVQQYPKSANAHDSLAEAYEKAGNKAAAIASYRQALVLDPKFESSIERLKVLAPAGR